MSQLLGPFAVKKNEAVTFRLTLAESADADEMAVNPPLVAGDCRVSTDGAAYANTATTPTVSPAGDTGVLLTLSAAEMNGDNVIVQFEDQTAPEVWEAVSILFHTYTADVDDLVRSTTPANTLDVSAGGMAGLDFANINAATGPTTLTNITVPVVTTLTGHTAQTGDNFARLGAPIGASLSADIVAVKSDTAAALVDTNELQVDWTNGGRLDLLIDSIIASETTLTTRVPDTISRANIQTECEDALNTAIPGVPVADSAWQRIRSMDLLTEAAGVGDLAAILTDTNELQIDWVNGGRLDLLIDSIITTIGTTGARVLLSQAYTEGQTARTIGGALEMAEAPERNRITVLAGTRTLFRNDGVTVIVARAQTSTQIG
jgi:hypothetical protein